MPEFVNPKFQDAEKTKFKATRLECLMQDFPRLFKHGAKVGFTKYDRWLCFTTVKNNLEDARKKSAALQPPDCSFSCEADIYTNSLKLLLLAGRAVAEKAPAVEAEVSQLSVDTEFLGIKKSLAPLVVLLPDFAVCLRQMRARLSGGCVDLEKGSMLVLEGAVEGGCRIKGAVDCRVADKNREGAAKQRGSAEERERYRLESVGRAAELQGAGVVFSEKEIANKGAALVAIPPEDLKKKPDAVKIRGYDLLVAEVFAVDDLVNGGFAVWTGALEEGREGAHKMCAPCWKPK